MSVGERYIFEGKVGKFYYEAYLDSVDLKSFVSVYITKGNYRRTIEIPIFKLKDYIEILIKEALEDVKANRNEPIMPKILEPFKRRFEEDEEERE